MKRKVRYRNSNQYLGYNMLIGSGFISCKFNLLLFFTISCLFITACSHNDVDPELEFLFTELKTRADQHELENFRNTPREVALVHYEIFENVLIHPFSFFNEPSNDSLFINFWNNKGRNPNRRVTEFMFAIAYHYWLNDEKIDFSIIEKEANHYLQLLDRKRELEFYKELDSKSYYRFFIPSDDSINIAIHQAVFSRKDLNEQQKEYYYLRALDSVVSHGIEDGKYKYKDWAQYYYKKELDHLLEILDMDDFPY